MKNLKFNSGITLIALVITIIVLLILAGVSISAIIGENGIVQKTVDAKEKTNAANADEEQMLQEATDYIDEYVSGTSETSFASQIDASDYGDYVNYSKDLGLTLNLEGERSVPKTDWRIFYKEGERVYLIAADYVPNTSTLLKTTEVGMATLGEYSFYWDSVSSVLAEGSRQDSLFGITNRSYILNASNVNSRVVSELLETSNWSNFVDSSVADYAIGGPTIEMYTKSWNAKGYGTLTESILNPDGTNSEYGYYINDDSWTDMSSDIGYGDNLYYPHKTVRIGNEDCYGYFLASPNSIDSCVMAIHSWGEVSGVFYGQQDDGWGIGVRPVVSLKSGISAEKDANGIWQLN